MQKRKLLTARLRRWQDDGDMNGGDTELGFDFACLLSSKEAAVSPLAVSTADGLFPRARLAMARPG